MTLSDALWDTILILLGTTLDKLVTMATTKGLTLICGIVDFGNAYFRKVTKFQGYDLFRSEVLSNLLGKNEEPSFLPSGHFLVSGVSA